MDGKKFLVIGLLGLFMISMFAGLVVAEDATTQPATTDSDIADQLGEIGGEIGAWTKANMKFTSVTEDINEYKGWLYAILLGMIIYTVTSSFFASSGRLVKWGVTIAVTAIAMLGIPVEIYNALELQYGAMGSAILSVIPFLIIFLFTMKVGSLLIARATWLFFIAYSLTMSWARFWGADAGQGWPYAVTFVVGVIMFFFIGWFRIWMWKGELDSHKEKAERDIAIAKAQKDMAQESRASESGIPSGS